MEIKGAQGKVLNIKNNGDYINMILIDEDGNEIENFNMEYDTASLFTVLLNNSVLEGENINKKFKREGLQLQKIQDVGTCFVNNNCRVSVAILPADENRTASILIGFHGGPKHNSIIIKPKNAAYLSIVVTKLIMNSINN